MGIWEKAKMMLLQKELTEQSQLISNRFVDNGNGTVTDSTTNLMWKRCAEGQTWNGDACVGKPESYSWREADSIDSGCAGYSDWRLPELDELKSLLNADTDSPCIDLIAFPDAPATSFLSRTAYGRSYRRYLSFSNGAVIQNTEKDHGYVRLVRSNISQPDAITNIKAQNVIGQRYIDNSDGTVTDTTTGLMWSRCPLGQVWEEGTCSGSPQTYTWEHASALVCRLADFADWRLPSIAELKNIEGGLRLFMGVSLWSCDAKKFVSYADGTTAYRSAASYERHSVLFVRGVSSEADSEDVKGPKESISSSTVSQMQPIEQGLTADSSMSMPDPSAWLRELSKAQAIQMQAFFNRLDALENRFVDSFAALNQRIDSIATDLGALREILEAVRQPSSSQTISAEIQELRDLLSIFREVSGVRQNPEVQLLVASPAVASTSSVLQVLAYLVEQGFDSISLGDLRRHLLPLDLLPSAVIEEVNERAFDLLGEPALEEDGDEVMVFRGVLTEVLAQWEGGER